MKASVCTKRELDEMYSSRPTQGYRTLCPWAYLSPSVWSRMSVIAEFTVPADTLALSETLTATPEMIVEIERVVAHDENRVMPYFWVRGDDYTAFETAVNDDPTVQNVTKLDEYEDGILYRAEWTQNIESLVYAYLETGATIVEATGRSDNWELRMRFDDEQLVTDFREHCMRNEIPFELNRLYHPTEPMAGGQFGLSPKQRTALLAAVEHGYFDIPRAVSMDELADKLGIAQQSLSKLLRRAHRNTVTNVLTVSHPDDDNTA
ncbi:bacterio-opsin activator domain-containing protein [Halorussus sp. GCM10023401]|uniref:helix-turn-helix domain-containing protein n=1 Tax=Halorussus vallis TaxID=2953749 RepID=UPI00209D952C|nr:bacterio-opsin activator domain-containing protein [Halorussus vallis]USZ75119.1 helix-turn-helix domain-containing protein [Halorussus vallis]